MLGVIVSSSVGGTAEQTVASCPVGIDVTLDAKRIVMLGDTPPCDLEPVPVWQARHVR